MKLRDLQAQLLRCKQEISHEQDEEGKYVFRNDTGDIYMWSPESTHWAFEYVDNVSEADGIRFLCPKSFAENGGEKGTHSVCIFFTGSPYATHNSAGEEVRWQVVAGTTIDDLQLSPSILEQDAELLHPCGWHGFVGNSGVPSGHAQ